MTSGPWTQRPLSERPPIASSLLSVCAFRRHDRAMAAVGTVTVALRPRRMRRMSETRTSFDNRLPFRNATRDVGKQADFEIVVQPRRTPQPRHQRWPHAFLRSLQRASSNFSYTQARVHTTPTAFCPNAETQMAFTRCECAKEIQPGSASGKKEEWQCVTLWCMRAGETRADIVFPDIPHWQRCLTTDSVFDGDVDRSFVRRDVLVPIRRRPPFSVFLFEKKRNRFGSHLPSETLVNLSHQQRAPAADSRDPVVQKDPVDRFGSSLQYPMTHPLSDPVRFANTRFRATIKKSHRSVRIETSKVQIDNLVRKCVRNGRQPNVSAGKETVTLLSVPSPDDQ